MNDVSSAKEDDALLAELTGAQQLWLAQCREATTTGAAATTELLGTSRETGVLARRSLATWKRVARTTSGADGTDEAILEEESERPDLREDSITADVSAARAMAVIAHALTGAVDVTEACATFLAHADRAGLHSVGTQLMPAGTFVTSDSVPLRDIALHLLGQGSEPARGYGILVALEIAGRRPMTLRVTDIRVLFASYGNGGRSGEAGILHLEQVHKGPSGLHADPAVMGFLQADEAFTDSLAEAWRTSRLADSDACVLWSVTLERGTPANVITGASMAAALAVALDDLAPRRQRLRQLRPRRLDPACAVTAGLSGTTLTAVTGYADKLKAAQQHSLRVIVATDALTTATQQAPAHYSDRITAAGTVAEAIRCARTRINHALWVVLVAAVVVVAAVTGTVTKFVHMRHEAAVAQAEDRSRLYANVSRYAREVDPAIAQQLALAAYRTRDTADARSALLESTATNTPIRIAPGNANGRGMVFLSDSPQLATSPGGDMVAVGEGDGTVELARVTDTGVARWPRFPTGNGHIRGLAISTDQRWLVTAGDGGSSVWDITDPAQPERVTDLRTEGHEPWTVALSPDTSHLAMGTQHGAILVWRLGADPSRPAFLSTLTVLGGQHIRVALSNRALAAIAPMSALPATFTTIVRIWHTGTLADNQTPAIDHRLERPDGAYGQAVAFSQNGAFLAVGLNPGEVARWRIRENPAIAEPLPSLSGLGFELFDIALDADGKQIVITSGGQKTRILDLETGNEVAVFSTPMISKALFLRGGRSLVTTSLDHSVQVFDLPGPVLHTGPRTLFRFPSGSFDQRADASLQALLLRLRPLARSPTSHEQNQREGDPSGSIDIVTTSPDGTRAVTVNEFGIQVWNIENRSAPTRLGAPLDVTSIELHGFVFSPDGRLAIGRGLNAAVEIWNVAGPDQPILQSTIRYPRGFPTVVAFNNDGGLLAIGSHNTGTVSVYDIHDPRAARSVADIAGLTTYGRVMSLALSPQNTLAIGNWSGVDLYDISHPGAPRRLPVPGGADYAVASVAFNDNGTRLAAAAVITGTGTIRMWDSSDTLHPTIYATLSGGKPRQKQTMISFTTSGTVLTESAIDGTVRLWRTDAAAEARRICASGTTPITREEWIRALPGTPYVTTCPHG
ncbi:WD40 repeat domain-containing protein [Nocardia suismassiliense]|uniref:WD40 repeat domain-containing protein n=1 Tax=Nocardia suismassiliense TaxID=2077092 RepID=UPI00131F3759|nr:hypothetical protein [Nocardia suismassiliense]